jgi:hypothetical protein
MLAESIEQGHDEALTRRRRPEDYIHEKPNGDINRNCGEFHKLALSDSVILGSISLN